MYDYYVNMNAQSTGEHEVHKEKCVKLPDPLNRKYLGRFENCHQAINEAKKFYENVDGCRYCSWECHTK